MDERGYQTDFSRQHDALVRNQEGRRKKGEKIVAVLKNLTDIDLPSAQVLDIGASTGWIDLEVAKHVDHVTGLDIDQAAIALARPHTTEHCHFLVGDAMHLPFKDQSFNILICAHVYEHVPNADRLMDEIERVLAPEGVCYFAAINRWAVVETHYKVPFLSWLPPPLADWTMRILGKGDRYYERPLSRQGLQRLTRRFECIDATSAILRDPAHFAATDVVADRSWLTGLYVLAYRMIPGISPSYIWILRKRPAVL